MRAVALVALLVAATGSFAPAAAGVSAGAPPAGPSTGAASHALTGPPEACTGVSFFTHRARAPPVTIGYSATPDTSVFFVLTADGSVVGHTDLQTYDEHVAVDGQPVPLDRNLTGFRTLTVTPHVDSNGNGAFDPRVDASCGRDTSATMTWFFPNETDALNAGPVTALTMAAGARTTQFFTYKLRQGTTVRTLAVDYSRTPASYASVTPNASDVNATVRIGRPDGTRGTASVADVSVRHGFLLVRLEDSLRAGAGATVHLHVEGVVNPRRDARVPVVVNPNGSAWTKRTRFDVREDGPVSGLTLFPVSDPSPPPFKVGFTMEGDATVGFAVYVEGELVGRSEFISPSAGTTVDGFEVGLTESLSGEREVTVYAVRDSNGNGVVDSGDRPYVHDGEYVRATGTYTFEGDPQTTRRTTRQTTSESPTADDEGGDGTSAGRTTPGSSSPGDVPGFGVAVAVVAAAAAALAGWVRR